MKPMLCVPAVVLAFSAFGQQQLPTTPPPYTTPPTFPNGQAAPREIPPDTNAPPPQEDLSAAQVEKQIQDEIRQEPGLAEAKVEVSADDKFVTLTGSVSTERQHQLAVRIATSNARHREIVDKIIVREHA